VLNGTAISVSESARWVIMQPSSYRNAEFSTSALG